MFRISCRCRGHGELELATRSAKFIPQAFVMLNLLLVVFSMETAAQDLTISVTTLAARPDDALLDSFIVDGSRMASFLLGSSKPSLMWGTVSFFDANAVCEQFHMKTLTGNFSFNINVDNGRKVTTKSNMTLGQIKNTGGCSAASDTLGTHALMVDQNGDQSALVCPMTANLSGCAIFLTNDLRNYKGRRELVHLGSCDWAHAGEFSCFPGWLFAIFVVGCILAEAFPGGCHKKTTTMKIMKTPMHAATNMPLQNHLYATQSRIDGCQCLRTEFSTWS